MVHEIKLRKNTCFCTFGINPCNTTCKWTELGSQAARELSVPTSTFPAFPTLRFFIYTSRQKSFYLWIFVKWLLLGSFLFQGNFFFFSDGQFTHSAFLSLSLRREFRQLSSCTFRDLTDSANPGTVIFVFKTYKINNLSEKQIWICFKSFSLLCSTSLADLYNRNCSQNSAPQGRKNSSTILHIKMCSALHLSFPRTRLTSRFLRVIRGCLNTEQNVLLCSD